MTPLRRVLRRVEWTGTNCWEFTGARDRRGYGRVGVGGRVKNGGRSWLTHRYVFEQIHGPVPAGLELDHLCRNPSCCNPAHLEPVTHRENIRRGDMSNVGSTQRARTHCRRGHPYAGENLYVLAGKRYCRACKAAFQAKKRAA